MSGPFGASQWMYATDSGFYPFAISNSLRLDSASETLLEKTNAGSGGSAATIATLSCWFKYNVQDVESSQMPLIWNDSDASGISFSQSSNTPHYIYVYWGGQGALTTTRFFRDSSAWYHIVAEIDSTQGTEANRLKLYINGVQVDWTGSFSQNTSSAFFNNNVKQRIGEDANNRHFSGYATDINAIEGTAYAASYFGEFKNDIWVPKNPSVTYGTNGFRLQFKNSGVGTASASTIGADTSGNTNHFTSTNIAANDQVPDSPTNNFATLNNLDTGGSNATYTEGNLKIVTNSGSNSQGVSTIPIPYTGKYYWEVHITATSGTISDHSRIGIQVGSAVTPSLDVRYRSDGTKSVENSGSNYGASYAANDIVSIAVDSDNNTVTFFKNGSSQGAINYTLTANQTYLPIITEASSQINITYVANFGQDSSFAGNATAQGNADENGIGDFYYAPPSGYLALCTANLPAPVATIDPAQGGSPQDYFNTALYTGNNANNRDITGVGFDPDFVWLKMRSGGDNHVLVDSLRGTNNMHSNNTDADADDSYPALVTDGFRVNGGTYNNNSYDFVAWNWKLNGTGAANTDGTINTTATTVAAHGGISISTYTGDGNDNATIGHGLSGTPELVIIKPRNYSDNWVISWGNGNGMSGLTSAAYMYFTGGAQGGEGNGRFLANDSDTVNLGNNWNNINKDSSSTYVMYCFRSIDGMQKIGTYVGNENADGTFVYTGFRPAFILIKKLAAGDWGIYDSKRDGFNQENAVLYPAEDIAEENQTSRRIDLLSNGFKLRTNNVTFNDDSATLFMAFAEQPFKYANAR